MVNRWIHSHGGCVVEWIRGDRSAYSIPISHQILDACWRQPRRLCRRLESLRLPVHGGANGKRQSGTTNSFQRVSSSPDAEYTQLNEYYFGKCEHYLGAGQKKNILPPTTFHISFCLLVSPDSRDSAASQGIACWTNFTSGTQIIDVERNNGQKDGFDFIFRYYLAHREINWWAVSDIIVFSWVRVVWEKMTSWVTLYT